jgi:hypothetical protein
MDELKEFFLTVVAIVCAFVIFATVGATIFVLVFLIIMG